MLLCRTMFRCFRTQVLPENQVLSVSQGERYRYTKSELEAMSKSRLVWLLSEEYRKSQENERDIISLKITRDACREAETLLLKKNKELESINTALKADVMQVRLDTADMDRQVNELMYIMQYASGEATRSGMELMEAMKPTMDTLRKCLMDPISLQMIRKPVIVTTGHTYEEAFLKTHLEKKKTCPTTNIDIVHFGHIRGVPTYYLADHRLAQVCDAFSKLEAAIEAAIHPKTRETASQAGASQLFMLE